ncbi:hypothetical protein SPH9361_04429 [Sphingobium sp. CECT 9361]|nr:hypothetical protein SPH9361_04429 [Sphingobium sp. CECT 9361]
MDKRGLEAQRGGFALQITLPHPIAEVESHAWLHAIELTCVATNRDGSTTALCRTASQAEQLRASLNAAIGRS